MVARRAMITTLTMYNIDDSIFDGITLPIYTFPRQAEYPDLFLSGWNMDKPTFINNLLLETAELDILYTDPEYFKFAVTQWSKKEFPVWQKLYETLFYKYNPIWNKDGTIKRTANEVRAMCGTNITNKTGTNNNSITENENISDLDNTNKIYNENESGTKSNTGNNESVENEVNTGSSSKTGANDTTVTESVAAFDTSTFANRNQNVTDNDTSEETSETNNKVNTKSDSRNDSESNTNDINGSDSTIRNYQRGRSNTNSTNGSNTENEEGYTTDTGNINNNEENREFGNIGVVTTQSMIEAERNLVKFNIYDFIIDSFKAHFCLLIY